MVLKWNLPCPVTALAGGDHRSLTAFKLSAHLEKTAMGSPQWDWVDVMKPGDGITTVDHHEKTALDCSWIDVRWDHERDSGPG